MFFSDDYLSETDKIDRIYRMLRAERRGRIISIIFKLSLLGLVVYGYYYLSLPAHADIRKKMIDTAQEKMTELIMPMVGSMVQDLTKNMLVPAQTSPTNKKNTTTNGALPANITPEMIKAAQDILNKR